MNERNAANSSPTVPPQPDCPKWFEHLPLARWGWLELNVFGWPMLVGALLLASWLCGPWRWLSLIPLVMFGYLLYFFRDPPRRVPGDPAVIVAPADGMVVDVTPLGEYEFIGEPAIRVGIFLSIFNVHINRAPLSGRVVETYYRPGAFLDARRPESSERNESMWIGFETTDPPLRRFAVRQISGLIARRIVCRLAPGATITRGEKFGMIKLGSRTELILPADRVKIVVAVGDRVHAGSDVVAHWVAAHVES
jgi:phosphatidylserine decarboxylase